MITAVAILAHAEPWKSKPIYNSLAFAMPCCSESATCDHSVEFWLRSIRRYMNFRIRCKAQLDVRRKEEQTEKMRMEKKKAEKNKKKEEKKKEEEHRQSRIGDSKIRRQLTATQRRRHRRQLLSAERRRHQQ